MRLAAECANRELRFVDLTSSFAALPAATLEQMYLPGRARSRHLSAQGHMLVAQTLQPRIRAILAAPPG